ncbi:YjiG family protein [uncultured Mailhella sp.]|uniref:YjiG family protein n=1 Tax=uncultured Mailhella sp. TaxID=1981031 RepID=UPI0025CC4E19|nr:YjiG family protein [uncultured Mailhella sp.]
MSHSLYAAFVDGAVKGWKVATQNMLPNVVLAFAFISLLQTSGLLDAVGRLCAPVMNLFGLPGESVTVLISTWFSAGGGVGAAAGLYSHGIMNADHVSIIMPAIFLMGAQIQYAGRILGVAGVSPRHYPALYAIGLLNSALAMLTMKLFFV